jgi:hypothetical protein
MKRDAPIEAVAAQVDEPPTLPHVDADGLPHGECVIFRVRPSNHGPVGPQQLEPTLMKLLVGDHVIVVAHRFKPIRNVSIRIEPPEL